jgi:nucleoside-diphosphate-sugar epimerase
MGEKNLKRFIYAPTTLIGNAISDLYRKSITICLVCDKKGKLLGVLTLSDIKQALLGGADPKAPIRSIMNTEFISAPKGASLARLNTLAKQPNKLGTGIVPNIPILNAEGLLVGLHALKGSKGREASTVLVTGGAGYMGSILCRHLLKAGYRVVVLDKLIFGDAGIRDLHANKDFSLIKGDIGDIGTLIEALRYADAVVHLAGIVGDPAASLNPIQTMEENHFATKMLIDLCRHYKVSRFVFASSCSVYGANPSLLNEESELRPVSLYAQSKMYSERELLKAADKHFHPVILRFGTLYGLSPRMRFDLVVNVMTAHAYFNKKITVDGGSQWRPLVHIDDAARACFAALTAPLERVSAQVFNVGDSKENYQIGQIAEVIKKHVPHAQIQYQDTVKDKRDYRVSFAKINRVMQFKAKHTLPGKVEELVEEFKKGKLKNWKDKKYNNYLTLRSSLEEMPS